MENNFYTNKFDRDFLSIGKEIIPEGIFNRFPTVKPVIGHDYESGDHRKLLLVGESFYFVQRQIDEESVFTDAEKWYLADPETVILVPDEPDKEAFRRFHLGHAEWGNETNWVTMKNPREVMEEFGFQYQSVARYNYFLRPANAAVGGRGFVEDITQLDREVAFIAFAGIIEVIKPDAVFFLGKFAFDNLQQAMREKKVTFDDVIMDFSPHPSSPHWNMAHYWLQNHDGKLTGKEKFKYFLEDNQIFKRQQ
jgi:hypothetical protein